MSFFAPLFAWLALAEPPFWHHLISMTVIDPDTLAQAAIGQMENAINVDMEPLDDSVPFRIESEFSPAGDQPTAIKELVGGVTSGDQNQVLLGVTGSGKTFTMAHVIETTQRPTLILRTTKPWRPSCMAK